MGTLLVPTLPGNRLPIVCYQFNHSILLSQEALMNASKLGAEAQGSRSNHANNTDKYASLGAVKNVEKAAEERDGRRAVANDLVWYTLIDGYTGEHAPTPGAIAVHIMPVST